MVPIVVIFVDNNRFDDSKDPLVLQDHTESRFVVIGIDMWADAWDATLPGVASRTHSIIGAGGVVIKSVPKWCSIGGSHEKVIRRKASNVSDTIGL